MLPHTSLTKGYDALGNAVIFLLSFATTTYSYATLPNASRDVFSGILTFHGTTTGFLYTSFLLITISISPLLYIFSAKIYCLPREKCSNPMSVFIMQSWFQYLIRTNLFLRWLIYLVEITRKEGAKKMRYMVHPIPQELIPGGGEGLRASHLPWVEVKSLAVRNIRMSVCLRNTEMK